MSHRTFADSVEILLFDLGGVLVHWDGIGSLRELTRARLSKEEARKFWLDSPAVRKFERGQISEVQVMRMDAGNLDGDLATQSTVQGSHPPISVADLRRSATLPHSDLSVPTQ